MLSFFSFFLAFNAAANLSFFFFFSVAAAPNRPAPDVPAPADGASFGRHSRVFSLYVSASYGHFLYAERESSSMGRKCRDDETDKAGFTGIR